MKKNNKGFSMVELIIVVAIIGILITAAALSVQVFFNAESKTAAESLTTLLNQSRISAFNGEPKPIVEVKYDPELGSYTATLYIGGDIDEDTSTVVGGYAKSTEQLCGVNTIVRFTYGPENSVAANSVVLPVDEMANGSILLLGYDTNYGSLSVFSTTIENVDTENTVVKTVEFADDKVYITNSTGYVEVGK